MVYDAKSGHGPHSSPPGAAASPKRLNRIQTANQAKFIPPITLVNQIYLFFLAHEEKYLILIELLKLNSNV